MKKQIIIGLAVVLLLSASLNIYQYTNTQKIVEVASQEQKEYTEVINVLSSKVETFNDLNDFVMRSVVVVPDDGSGLFHRWDCPNAGMDDVRFNVFNREFALWDGYTACDECY